MIDYMKLLIDVLIDHCKGEVYIYIYTFGFTVKSKSYYKFYWKKFEILFI